MMLYVSYILLMLALVFWLWGFICLGFLVIVLMIGVAVSLVL